MIPYEDQETDLILEEFRRSAVSNILETEPTTHRDTSLSMSGTLSVRQQILQRFAWATKYPTNFPSFVPIDTLTELIDVKTVSMTLAEAGRRDLSSATCANIANTLPRIFATLLITGKVEAIIQFELQGFTDDIFPLLRADAPPKGRETRFRTWYSTIHPLSVDLDDDIHPVSNCFQDPSLWTLAEFGRFYHSQWLFSAPVFALEKFEYLLDPKSPLPFTTLSPYGVGTGQRPFSQVYMASIHPAHLPWQNTVRVYLFCYNGILEPC